MSRQEPDDEEEAESPVHGRQEPDDEEEMESPIHREEAFLEQILIVPEERFQKKDKSLEFTLSVGLQASILIQKLQGLGGMGSGLL